MLYGPLPSPMASSHAPLTAVVADDEPLARRALHALLDELGGVEVLGEAADGHEALARVEAHRPDLLFLDVQMPELTGLGVLRRLAEGGPPPPVVVLTTAYDEHAVAAYELGALDYLLKPFAVDRLARALDRVRPLVAARGEGPAHLLERQLVAEGALGGRPLDRLFVRERGRMVQVRAADIVRLEAQGDYALVCTASGGRHLTYMSMNEFEARLDPATFVRIHRSAIVNLDHVRALVPYDSSRFSVELADGTRLVASRTRSRRLRSLVF